VPAACLLRLADDSDTPKACRTGALKVEHDFHNVRGMGWSRRASIPRCAQPIKLSLSP